MIDAPKEFAEWKEVSRAQLEKFGPISDLEWLRMELAFKAGAVRGICCSLAELKEMGVQAVKMRVGKG